jgi:hypothetical protein
MSKRDARQMKRKWQAVKATRKRNMTALSIVLLLLLPMAHALATRLSSHDNHSGPASLYSGAPLPVPTPTPSPTHPYPNKEYIYAGDRLIAAEDPLPTAVGDGSTFISQSGVPAQIIAGQTYSVTLIFKNTGVNDWDTASYWLGSQTPQANSTWGLSRVNLSNTTYAALSQTANFNFTITAPSTPGAYNFQWQMVHNNETFGALSTLMTVNVIAVENVIWGNLTGTSASGNNLTSTAPNGWGNSGAASTRALASGDGYVEFTANEVNLSRMCGLNNGDTNQTFQEIDYAIYIAYDATIEVWENGIYRGDYGTYQANDRFRVSVEGGVVKYSKGGTVFYTSTVAPSYPLRVDTALAHTNATLTNVIISGTLQYVSQSVFWIGNTTNVGINGNSLTKNAGSDAAWDGGAVSSLALAPGDGYVEFEASETTTDRLVGLSYSGAVPNYWGIDSASVSITARSISSRVMGRTWGASGLTRRTTD